jgi:hypothetical protein
MAMILSATTFCWQIPAKPSSTNNPVKYIFFINGDSKVQLIERDGEGFNKIFLKRFGWWIVDSG